MAVREFAKTAALPTRSDPARLQARARLLQANVGVRKADVYGFTDDHGRPCYIMVGFAGACATLDRSSTPGLTWIVGGADLGMPGLFIAAATDDVKAVTLTIDGMSIEAPVKENIAFAEYDAAAQTIVVRATYADGGFSSASIDLAG